MDSKERDLTAAEKLKLLLYQKGYRRRFTLSVPGSGYPRQMGDLGKCLELFFQLLEAGRGPSHRLELETLAPYNDRIACRLKLDYSESNGFNIRELTVHSYEGHEHKQFRFASNNELPGSMTLEGMFPKPKPYAKYLKGRFRP